MAVYNSAGQQSSDVEDLEERYKRSKTAKTPQERKWILQLSYFGGQQWMAIDRTGRLYEPEMDPYKLKLVDNRIMPSVLHQVAKMTKHRPVITVVPRTGDEADISGAKLAESILDWEWEFLDLTRKRRQAILWSRICSAGFWKICWDDRKGDPFQVMAVDDGAGEKILLGPDGRPMRADDPASAAVLQNMDPVTAETARAKTLHTGDIAVHVRSPFAIFPDPLAPEEGLEDTEWVIEETIQSREWVQAHYDVEVEADSQAQMGVMEARMPGLETEAKIGVVVREFWAKKSYEFPNGKHVVYANDRTISEKDNAYGWLPYVMFRGTPFPGRFWPSCVVEQQISPQTELNKTISQIAENAARIGNPPLARSRQANVEWDGLPGSNLWYDDTLQNSLPSFLQVPEMPVYIQNRSAQILESMGDIAGQHEVSNGNVPTGVTAAAAINLLQEADDTRLGPDIEDMEMTLQDAGKRIVQLVAENYTDARIIRIGGQETPWNIFEFKGAMLNGNTDVSIQAGSGMPRSKAAKQAAMQEVLNLALQYGMQLDQRSLRKFFKDYEVGGLEQLLGDIDQDEAQVNSEHQRFYGGEAFPPNDFDNHEFHVDAHNGERKTYRYRQADPRIQQAMDQHVRLHEQALQQAAQAQADAELKQMEQQAEIQAKAQAKYQQKGAQ